MNRFLNLTFDKKNSRFKVVWKETLPQNQAQALVFKAHRQNLPWRVMSLHGHKYRQGILGHRTACWINDFASYELNHSHKLIKAVPIQHLLYCRRSWKIPDNSSQRTMCFVKHWSVKVDDDWKSEYKPRYYH